jgi:arylsulfatase A-like enzyme/Tfp pilus assembly protein PilF
MLRRLLLLLVLAVPALAASRPNIILITLDGTRADRMGFLGAKRSTPQLDALAQKSLIFERAYAQAPTTVVSHSTILTGLYPQAHGMTEFGSPLGASLPYFPDILRAGGYKTAAFVSTIQLDPHSGTAGGIDRGFASFDAGFHAPRVGESRYVSVERRAADVALRATAWLQKTGPAPFFLWVQLSDPGNGEAATDAAVGKVLAALQARKMFEGALIVVVSACGEPLGAHGEDAGGVFLYDETVHVPLLVKLPANQMAGKRVTGRVQLVDIAPTALDVAGLPAVSKMQGQSLLRVARATGGDQPAYARSDYSHQAFGWSPLESWRVSKYLMVRAPQAELYDLTQDSAAAKNVAGNFKGTLDTLAGQVEGFDRRVAGDASASAKLSSSEIQKLASLGYVGLNQQATGSATIAGTDPKDKIGLANTVHKALAAIEDGKPQAAIPALQAVVTQDANLYLAQYALGVGYLQQAKYPQSIEHLRKAIQLMPESSWANFQMGVAMLKSGNGKTAVTHFEIALSRNPKWTEASAYLAQAKKR